MNSRLCNENNANGIVSIIVPIYNVEPFLEQCLESIVGQSYQNLEILLINDGSTDGSLAIAQEYERRDPRVRVINKKNEGYGASCNLGLKLAQGSYFCIVEPDDYIREDMVSILMGEAKRLGSDIVKAKFKIFRGDELPESVFWHDEELIPRRRLFSVKECGKFFSYHPSIWTCIYRLSYIKEQNIAFQTIPGAGWADNLFQVKSLLSAKISYCPQELYFYRVLDPSLGLKDISLPINRSIEINEWLKEHCVRDREVIFNIARREIGYVNLILESPACRFSDLKNVYKMFEGVKLSSVELNKMSIKEKKIYSSCFEGRLWKALLSNKVRRLIRKCLRIHITRRKKIIRIFNFTLLDK